MVAAAILRVTTFVLHFASSIFLLNVSFRCGDTLRTQTFAETVFDSSGYALVMNSTCSDPYSSECFYGLPQTFDVVQHSLSWNVFALLAAFEWLSASFALYYLDDIARRWWQNATGIITTACLVWNVAGIILLMPYNSQPSTIQTGVTTLALLAASASQITAGFIDPNTVDDPPSKCCKGGGRSVINGLPVVVPPPSQMNTPPTPTANTRSGGVPSSDRVIQHYSEYCTSASLLFVAVLILFVQDPVSWAPLFGFTGIMICNITGIGAHNCKLDFTEEQPTRWYDLDWTKCGNHFKLFLLHSWLALIASIMIIIYLSRDSLTSSDVPGWVRFILWNLLVTYTLFGVWATICYGMAGQRGRSLQFDKWMERLDFGLTVLSAAAKLPIAYTVFMGLIQEPGGSACSI